jgi:hypothetical protein
LPLVKDGVDWGWINLYRNFDGDSLLVDTNYLVDLFRLELTAAAERIFQSHQAPARRVELPLEMLEEVSG